MEFRIFQISFLRYEDVCKKKVPRAVFYTQNVVQVGQEHDSAHKLVFGQVLVYTKPEKKIRGDSDTWDPPSRSWKLKKLRFPQISFIKL